MLEPSVHMSEKFLVIWNDFQNKLKTDRAKDNYFSTLCMICNFASKDFLDLTYSDADKYFRMLQEPKSKSKRVKLSTVQGRLSALRSVSSYIKEFESRYDLGEVYENFFFYIKLPEQDVFLKKEDVPTINEVDRLLIAADNNLMMFLIISMVFRCGFTASEICKMTISQLISDPAENYGVEFRERGGTRIVKLPHDVVTILKKYLQTLPVGLNKSEFLFHNKRGTKLTVRNLDLYVSELVKEAGLSKPFTIKDIRHATIVHMRKANAKDEDIANCLGLDTRWIFRYDQVVEELKYQPMDLVKIRIEH